MEFWDVAGQRKVSNPQAIDSTYFEWCPDGEHFITATTTPRLRVGNWYVEPLSHINLLYCIVFKYLYSAPQQPWANRGAFGSTSSKKCEVIRT